MRWLLSIVFLWSLLAVPPAAPELAGPGPSDAPSVIAEFPTGGETAPDHDPSEDQPSADDPVLTMAHPADLPAVAELGRMAASPMPASAEPDVPSPPPVG